MSSFKIFDIAGSGMNAQNLRMNVVASNLANVDAVSSSIDETYKARQPVFRPVFDQANLRSPAVGVQMAGVESQAPWCVNTRHSTRWRQGRLHLPTQRQRGRRDGQHDLGLARLSEQRRGGERDAADAQRHHQYREVMSRRAASAPAGTLLQPQVGGHRHAEPRHQQRERTGSQHLSEIDGDAVEQPGPVQADGERRFPQPDRTVRFR